MKTKTLSCCALLVAHLAGCATDTTQIQASYVSPYEYDDYTCTRLRAEAARITRKAKETGARIDATAAEDAVRAFVGLLLPTSWLLIEGNDPADTRRYAELKGQTNTIEEASIRNGCDIEFTTLAEGNLHMVAEKVRRLQRSAELGDTTAQFTLGSMYHNGAGVPEDAAEAVRWFRQAATQGHATAQLALGVSYALGEGVPQDKAEAARWLVQAAEQGLATAQVTLGLMYHNGEGVPRDAAEAVRWYRLAAIQGDAAAQNNLGVMYSRGEGVARDSTEAVQWYSRAAEQGYAYGQLNLGDMYEHGTGVERDFVQAHKWYNLAASGFQASEQDEREEAVRRRDRVASLL